ncbi:hypothetical protein GGX14DRAFT_391135 [Mycena pura]|uniref:Uncharacterized protein n=1 Tax=Mycena pura TaxID=153505 RepID=A0AAD6VQN9_9AGAR|nr:hypothetical protein GGX14DRAFT_391135 [Mycena pura]
MPYMPPERAAFRSLTRVYFYFLTFVSPRCLQYIIILRGDWAAGECATGKDRIGKRVGSSSGAGAGACEGAADLAAGSRAPAQRVVLFCPRSRRGCGERAQGRTVADQKCEGAVTARFSATRCSLSHNLITNSSTQLLVPHDTTGRGSVFYPLPLCPIPLLYRWATLHTDTACNRLQSILGILTGERTLSLVDGLVDGVVQSVIKPAVIPT